MSNTTDLAKYPLLVTQVDASDVSARGGASGSGRQKVQNAIREILGWRPRKGDSKGLQAALKHSITYLEDEDGRDGEWIIAPGRYTAQADLGAITGAQASLHRQAKLFVDECLALLDNLEPLATSVDEEDRDARLALIRTELEGIVAELSNLNGPLVAKIDLYLKLLIGYNPTTGETIPESNPRFKHTQLGALREKMGLVSDKVNTVEEEQILTDFRMLVDYVGSFATSWDQHQNELAKSLGIQFTLLTQRLDVVATTVQELFFVLDSVYIDEAERQIIDVENIKVGTEVIESISVQELLNWIESFATTEGIQMLQDGGRYAVSSTFVGTLTILEAAAKGLDNLTEPDGFRTARVKTAVKALSSNLNETVKIVIPEEDTSTRVVNKSSPPTLSIESEELYPDKEVLLTVTGPNVQEQSLESWNFGPSITAKIVKNDKEDEISILVTPHKDTETGLRTVTVMDTQSDPPLVQWGFINISKPKDNEPKNDEENDDD